MIEVKCPQCGTTMRVKDEAAGRTGRCKQCNAPVVVPSPQELEPDTFTPMSDPPDPLASLRKEVKFHRFAIAGLCVAHLLVAWGRSQKSPVAESTAATPSVPAEIRARSFVVVDSKGEVRARLGRDGHPTRDQNASTGLMLFTDGKERGEFAIGPHGCGVMSFTDAEGTERLSLLGEVQPGLRIADKEGNGRLEAGFFDHQSGSAYITLYGTDSKESMQMGVRQAGTDPKASLSYLEIFTPKQKLFQFIDDQGVPLPSPRSKY